MQPRAQGQDGHEPPSGAPGGSTRGNTLALHARGGPPRTGVAKRSDVAKPSFQGGRGNASGRHPWGWRGTPPHSAEDTPAKRRGRNPTRHQQRPPGWRGAQPRSAEDAPTAWRGTNPTQRRQRPPCARAPGRGQRPHQPGGGSPYGLQPPRARSIDPGVASAKPLVPFERGSHAQRRDHPEATASPGGEERPKRPGAPPHPVSLRAVPAQTAEKPRKARNDGRSSDRITGLPPFEARRAARSRKVRRAGVQARSGRLRRMPRRLQSGGCSGESSGRPRGEHPHAAPARRSAPPPPLR